MSPFIPAVERLRRARLLIQEARDLPVPFVGGKYDLTYIARVKTLLQDARDLVKFIPKTPSATEEIKEQVKQILEDADQANKDIFHSR